MLDADSMTQNGHIGLSRSGILPMTVQAAMRRRRRDALLKMGGQLSSIETRSHNLVPKAEQAPESEKEWNEANKQDFGDYTCFRPP